MSLTNPYLDNALPESWLASKGMGTPGRKNDVYSDRIPDGLSVGQSYPNPFESLTTIPVSIQIGKKVTVTVYNIGGQKVCTLYNATMKPGIYNMTFDASSLPSGVYIYQVKTNVTERYGKAMLIK